MAFVSLNDTPAPNGIIPSSITSAASDEVIDEANKKTGKTTVRDWRVWERNNLKYEKVGNHFWYFCFRSILNSFFLYVGSKKQFASGLICLREGTQKANV